MSVRESRRPGARAAAAYSLAADAAAAEISRELRAAGLPCLLLKGPGLADWLYPEAARTYVDADLLVPADAFAQARQILERLGFELQEDELPPADEPVHAEPWARPADGACVDLHRTLFGAAVDPKIVWRLLSGRAETKSVGGASLAVPQVSVRALIVALHAAQHGPETSKPLEDLRRALEEAPVATWAEAAELAERLNATMTFTAGLGLLPAGAELARVLGLPEPERARGILASHTPVLAGIDRLGRARGPRAKLRVALQLVVPSPGYMRWSARGAADTRRGLALAYARRFGSLLAHLPALLGLLRRRSRPGVTV